jgi:hypothetical protein
MFQTLLVSNVRQILRKQYFLVLGGEMLGGRGQVANEWESYKLPPIISQRMRGGGVLF